MAIEVSDRAREWLKRKGGVVTLCYSPRHGCCGGRVNIAVAEVRAPDAPERYTRLECDGVVLYIDPTLLDHGLRLDVEGFLGLRP
ncbi:CC/Se motif family (seleno)protein [Halomonas ventosae]|uniref:Fe-S cluster assembly iron-binding protein IscA n=1 Tax=Halomonas ventosae TaxID=229007 RepID=A0A2T0VNR6_9GAMM|nr:CC/Se motif family (seleno)protein [Halomonas ventosae]PRY71996.1 hypothetical protein BCL64_105138 [Halomonas ventosae]